MNEYLYAVFTKEVFMMGKIAKAFSRLFKKLQKATESFGYACDGCKRELFDYPNTRLCPSCETRLRKTGDKSCEKCGRQTRVQGVCLTCKQQLPSFTRGFAPFVYIGEGAAFVNRMKEGEPRLALYLGEKMADGFMEAESPDSVLVLPVPTTKKRLKERGYNPSNRLSSSVCGRLKLHGIEVETDETALIKVRETPMQKHMSRAERMQNVKGAFHLHKRKLCQDKTVLLIDDILTTGSTASECASLILRAGAKKVFVLVAAALPERE